VPCYHAIHARLLLAEAVLHLSLAFGRFSESIAILMNNCNFLPDTVSVTCMRENEARKIFMCKIEKKNHFSPVSARKFIPNTKL
jgi:hypothetical protein